MGVDPLQVLQERAQRLARRAVSAHPTGLPLTVFTRGKQLFGVRLPELEGAGRLKDMSPIPGGASWMMGALHHRGEVVTLVDLLALWGQTVTGVADLPTYLIITDGMAHVGILVEELRGVQEMDKEASPYQGVERAGLSEVAHLAGQPVLILSASALLQDPRFQSVALR